MLRRRPWLAVLALLPLAGCDRASNYLAVFHEQRAAWTELADALATVKDEKSMEAARAELDDRLVKYEKIARRARALPEPPREVRDRLEEERVQMQQAADRLQAEVRRVRALPGGDEFLQQFEKRHPGLLRAQR